MDSDDTSTNTVYHTISQFNNSDIETPDEFADSEPSPSTFSQPPFQPLQSQITNEAPSTPSSYTDETPTYSPLTSVPPYHSSPIYTELENELDNIITLQQHIQHANTLNIHHLPQSMTSSESSNLASTTGETRAHRVVKRKLPNTTFPSNPRPAQTISTHPLHTNTKIFYMCA